MTVLEHRRSTRSEGWESLGWISMTAAIFVVMEALFFHHLWREERIFFILFNTVCAPIVGLGLCYSIINIIRNQEFVCKFDGETFECICPIKACGPTFKLRIAEIEKIEKRMNDGSPTWYIWDRAGHCHFVPNNYGNPAEDFIEAIREASKSIIEFRT
jgi:hypothetical protein